MILPNILPMEVSTITNDGIDFNGELYTCPLAIKEQWFVPQECNEERKLSVCFDPFNPDLLLLIVEGIGAIPAYKKSIVKPMDQEMLEVYFSAINVLKSKWKLQRKKKIKRRVKE
jgi:hypothetical protein